MKLRVLPLVALLALIVAPPLGHAEDDAAASDTYSAQELEEIVGPIALYPDIVLDAVLPASTYPLDVISAARYVKAQGGSVDEVPDNDWDVSVKALLQYPDVLAWMNENLDWMEQLGYAVAVQQGEVLQAIQDFRKEAEDAGNLETNDQMTVSADNNNNIIIEPTNPEVVYVPTYDPQQVVVYGGNPGWGWGWGFAAGVAGAWAFHNIRWGAHGGYGGININNSPTYNIGNRPGNRPGGGNRPGNRPGAGKPWKPGNRPGAGRPGNRPGRPGGPVNRPGRPGNRPGAGRPGGNRPGAGRPGGGVKPPSGGNRPGGSRPGGRPGGTRPSKPSRPAPGAGRPGGGNRPGAGRPGGGGSRPGAGSRPSTRPSNRANRGGSNRSRGGASSRGPSNRSSYGGSSRGRSSRSHSSRGRSSRSASRGGGRSRGGGGRRGGGRRR